MTHKGINAADIITVMLAIPKNHPKRDLLINLMNTAFRMSGVLPKSKETAFINIIKDLKKEGVL